MDEGVGMRMTQVTVNKVTLLKILEALYIGYDAAKAEAEQYHSAMAGYRTESHKKIDEEVETVAKSISELKKILEIE
jgi:hypothetical protein